MRKLIGLFICVVFLSIMVKAHQEKSVIITGKSKKIEKVKKDCSSSESPVRDSKFNTSEFSTSNSD